MADPEKLDVKTVVGRETIIGAGVWIVATLMFVYNYFSHFSPSYLRFFSYPEGKFGPPLLKEQPFFLISWAVLLATVGYTKIIWGMRNLVIRHVDGKVSPFVTIIRQRAPLIIGRCIDVMGTAMMYLCLENLVFRPHSYVLFVSFFGRVLPFRKPLYSFWEFTDPAMIYHFIISAIIFNFMLSLVEITVEMLFGVPFLLTRGKTNANHLLLSGLRSRKVAVRNQAILEIHHVIEREDKWRASFFRDFQGDEAVSRSLCLIICQQLNAYREHLMELTADLKHVSSLINQKIDGTIDGTKSPLLMADKDIFSPRKMSLMERFLTPILKAASASAESTLQPTEQSKASVGPIKKPMPDILSVKPTKLSTEAQIAAPTTLQQRYAWKSGNMSLINALFTPLAALNMGKVYSFFFTEIVKSWWLDDETVIVWLIESLSGLLVASYDEDIHGQVQFLLASCLNTLCDLFVAVEEYETWPMIGGVSMARLVYDSELSPIEARCRRLSSVTMTAVESVMDTFADSLHEAKLGAETQQKLKKLGFTY